MTRREDYLGCRVSERGDSVKYKVINGIRIPYRIREPQFPTPADNYSAPSNEVEKFEQAVYEIFFDARNILLSKHHDYGPTNIANAPGGALNGLRVRIHDKTARINNLIDSNKNAQHESLRDSFLDLMNYAAIALLVIDGNWPGVEPDDTEADCG